MNQRPPVARTPRPPDAPRAGSSRPNRLGRVACRGSVVCLSAATLLLIGSLALALTTTPLPRPVATTPGAMSSVPADLVPRFYAELNARLGGAPPGQNPSGLSPDLVVTESGAPDRPLAAWLRQLRVAHPLAAMLQVVPTAQRQHGDRIAVTVQLRRSPTALADPGGPPVPLPPETLDQLTLAHGQVVAYAPGPALTALPWTRPPVSLGPVTQPTTTALLRLAFAPGAGLADLVASGPELLLVEHGDLDVTWTGGGQLLRTGAAAWQPLLSMAHALTLAPGDALLLPDSVRHVLRTAAATPVVLLALAAFPAALLSPMTVAPHVGPVMHSLVDLANPVAVGVPRQAVGVTATTLATAMGGRAGDGWACTLTVSQVTLGPGEAIAAHRVDGVELVALEGGWLTIGTDDGRPPSPPTSAVDLGRSTGSAPPLRNAGVGPLPVIVFTLTPQRAGPCRGGYRGMRVDLLTADHDDRRAQALLANLGLREATALALLNRPR